MQQAIVEDNDTPVEILCVPNDEKKAYFDKGWYQAMCPNIIFDGKEYAFVKWMRKDEAPRLPIPASFVHVMPKDEAHTRAVAQGIIASNIRDSIIKVIKDGR